MASWAFVLIMFLTFEAIYCEEYLIAMAKTFKTADLIAATGNENGSIHFKLPDSKENKTIDLSPYNQHRVTLNQRSQASNGVDNKAFVVKTSSEDISILGCYRYAAFTPLPISALGTKYMLPFCGVNQKKSFLVIAAHDQQTEITITLRLNAERFVFNNKLYNDGNIITQTLDPHQTFIFNYEHNMTGTEVESSHPVAVFMGSIYTLDVETYEQIPPVSAYGKEHVVAVEDVKEDHKLQIVSADYGNEIHFNDGRMVRSRFYSEILKENNTLHIKTTKPVMVALCRLQRYRYNSGLVVVPPVSLYRMHETALYVSKADVLSSSAVKILTKTSSDVTVQGSSREQIQTTWSQIPGTDYKVGTCQIPNDNITSFTSNHGFTLLAFTESSIYNGGFYSEHFGEAGVKPTRLAANSKMTQHVTAGVKRPVVLVGIICGVVILALIVVLATLVTCLKRRRGQRGDDSMPGTSMRIRHA